MKEQNNEVFNVSVQSTRPDGYRRGGFDLKRGINQLKHVSFTALMQIKRDKSVAILDVERIRPDEPLGMGNQNVTVNLDLPQVFSTDENTGAQQLDNGMNADTSALLKTPAELALLIPQLTPEQFTQSGVPDSKALATLAGQSVTAAERDEAWALHLANADDVKDQE